MFGIDPNLDFVPEEIRAKTYKAYEIHGKTLEGAADALLRFNKALIEAVYDIVTAMKPQAAFYEKYDWQGVRTLAETISYA